MYIHNIPKYMAFYFACQMALNIKKAMTGGRGTKFAWFGCLT